MGKKINLTKLQRVEESNDYADEDNIAHSDDELISAEPIIELNSAVITPKNTIPEVINAIAKVESINSIEDDPVVKRRRILTIQFYFNEYADELRAFMKINLEKKTIAELDALTKEIQMCLNRRGDMNKMVDASIWALETLENVCVEYTPLRVKGLANQFKDEETRRDIKLVLLERLGAIETTAEQRLLFKLVQTSAVLHKLNSDAENALQKAPIIINSETNSDTNNTVTLINEKFADLG